MEISYIIKLIEERKAVLRKEMDAAKTQLGEAVTAENLKDQAFYEREYDAAYREWYKLSEALTILKN